MFEHYHSFLNQLCFSHYVPSCRKSFFFALIRVFFEVVDFVRRSTINNQVEITLLTAYFPIF